MMLTGPVGSQTVYKECSELHCMGAQDVAIAYGYNNVPWTVPPVVTVGKELPLNQLCELLRGECAMAGYTEVRFERNMHTSCVWIIRLLQSCPGTAF